MKSKSLILSLIGILILALVVYPARVNAGVNVNIGINVPLPTVVIPAPPAVIVIAGTYIYFVPDVQADILFYRGYWYRPHQGHWYQSTSYNGPWGYIERRRVPGVLLHLPPDFRHVPPGHERIPYGQFKKNWTTWEKEKHWDKHKGKKK